MNVFLTGANGYVGSAILNRLLGCGHRVYALVRKVSELKLGSAQQEHNSHDQQVIQVTGDLLIPDTYAAALENCEAVIHLVGIIREDPPKGITFQKLHIEGTRVLAQACKLAKIKKILHMSALGARDNAVSTYHSSKYAAETIVRDSGIPSVIFRPSVIFGPGDEFVTMLAGLIKLPLTPVIGNGRYRLQPVSIHTIADIFEKALHRDYEQLNPVFDVGGPEQISYNDLIKQIAKAMNRNVILFHQPLWLMKPMINIMERFPFFPITNNQLTMLLEENICRDGNRFVKEFKVTEIPFVQGIGEYIH